MSTHLANARAAGRGQADIAAPRKLNPAILLAALGGVIVVYSVWTWGAWLLDGPSQVTSYRDTSAVSWWVARVYELLIVLVTVYLASRVIRSCIRERLLKGPTGNGKMRFVECMADSLGRSDHGRGAR